MSLGPFCESSKQLKRKKYHWVSTFLSSVRQSYKHATSYLLTNLPLKNATLLRLSVFDPKARKQTTTIGIASFQNLAMALPNIPVEQLGFLRNEIGDYCSDTDLDTLFHKYRAKTDCRIDCDWWSVVCSLKTEHQKLRFPLLKNLVEALDHLQWAFR